MNNKSGNIKRILILGHSGFIGSHLVRYFRSIAPQIEVIGRSVPEVDLTKEKDVNGLSSFFDIKTTVIMCAAIKRQFGDNLDSFWKNLSMSINLCRLLEKYPVRRFIFFSSTAVYGEDIHNTNITEQTLVTPTSHYGMAKYSCERLFSKVISQQNKSSLVILRPPLIYGPGDEGDTYGPVKFIKVALNQGQITLWGDGEELREFIFVEDIVKVVHYLTFHDYDGVINVASGKSHTFKDIVDIVSHFMPEKLRVTSRPRTKNKADNAFCNTRFTDLLKDFSFTALREGIKKTIAAKSKELILASHDNQSEK